MKIAEKVTIGKNGISIEGKKFPFYLSDAPIIVTYDVGINLIQITLLAGYVEVDPDLFIESNGDVFIVSQKQDPTEVVQTEETT